MQRLYVLARTDHWLETVELIHDDNQFNPNANVEGKDQLLKEDLDHFLPLSKVQIYQIFLDRSGRVRSR